VEFEPIRVGLAPSSFLELCPHFEVIFEQYHPATHRPGKDVPDLGIGCHPPGKEVVGDNFLCSIDVSTGVDWGGEW
jgi:hypothetical protein